MRTVPGALLCRVGYGPRCVEHRVDVTLMYTEFCPLSANPQAFVRWIAEGVYDFRDRPEEIGLAVERWLPKI